MLNFFVAHLLSTLAAQDVKCVVTIQNCFPPYLAFTQKVCFCPHPANLIALTQQTAKLPSPGKYNYCSHPARLIAFTPWFWQGCCISHMVLHDGIWSTKRRLLHIIGNEKKLGSGSTPDFNFSILFAGQQKACLVLWNHR